MVAREPAWRVFAHEFNQATLQYKEDEEHGPTYVISPTGAKMNRVFVVGVLTEVEDLSSSDLRRARIADPTGSFTIYAGKYQADTAAFLAQAEAPQFITALGRARLYTRNETSYASIWPKEVNSTTETVRNNWVINTAERTLDRLEALRIASSSGLQNDELREKLLASNVHPSLTEGIVRAAAYYNAPEVIADMVPMIASAIDAIAEPRGFTTANVETRSARDDAGREAAIQENERAREQQEATEAERESSQAAGKQAINTERVLATMKELDTGSGVPYDTLIEALAAHGLEEDDVEEAVQDLMEEGKCYEPKIGLLKLI
jgi:RPA family protein